MTAKQLTVEVNRIELASGVTREEIVRAVLLVAEEEGVARGEVSVTFLDAAAMTSLNHTHLQQARVTDVIAFNLGELSNPLGDVYICPEVAEESALEFDVELREELLRLVVHATLHILGYDHPQGPERLESAMFRRQEEILSRLT